MDETTKKTIASISISQLRQLAGEDFHEVSFDGCTVCRGNGQHLPSGLIDLLRYPCRIDSSMIIIGLKGRVSISCNLNSYELRSGMLFAKGPDDIVQLIGSVDFECVAIFFEAPISRDLHIDYRRMINLFLSLHECPVIDMTDDERDDLLHVLGDLGREFAQPHAGPFSDEVVRSYLRYFLYKVFNLIGRYNESRPSEPLSAKSRNEEYFHRFIQELSQHYRSERSVGFYASRLCITPKYLSTLIKQVSGRTASTWIDQYVILEAKNLLRFSRMSIQEVAYYLNFPNQSFFGKYFRHQTGMSPSAYKTQK